MNALQEAALRGMHTNLIRHIEPNLVAPALYECNLLSSPAYDEINQAASDQDKNKILLKRVLNSDNPESFDLFLNALKTQHPFLHNQLFNKLNEQCCIALIHDMVQNDNVHKEPEEHDERPTARVRLRSAPNPDVTEDFPDPPMRQTQSVRMRRQRLTDSHRQTAIERISQERVSRGESPLDVSNATELRKTLVCELQIHVVEMRAPRHSRVSDRSTMSSTVSSISESSEDNGADDDETRLKDLLRNSGVEVSSDFFSDIQFGRCDSRRLATMHE